MKNGEEFKIEGLEDWFAETEKKADEQKQKDARSAKFREWGKLGGRPKKDTANKSAKIEVSVSPTEKELIQKNAKQFGYSTSEFLRMLGKGIKPKQHTDEKVQALQHWAEMKTHLMRISNMCKYKKEESFREVNKQVLELAELIKQQINDWYRKNG